MDSKSTLVVEKRDPELALSKDMKKEQASLLGKVYLLAYDAVRSLFPLAERYALLKQTVLLACLVIFLGLLMVGALINQSGASSAPAAQALGEKAPPDLSTRPFGIGRAFLSSLREEKLAEAHEFLTAGRSRLVSPAELRALAQELQREEQALTPLDVLSEVVRGRNATVLVGQTLQGKPDNLWTLHFRSEDGTWKLASAEGQSFPKRLWAEERSD